MENNKSLNVLKALVFLILCFGSMEAFAEAKTWSGADGASFNVGTNWTPNGVPDDDDDVTINAAGTVVINGDIDVNSITINNASAILRPSGSTGLDVIIQDFLDLQAGSILYTNTGGTGELSWTFEGNGGTNSITNGTAAEAQMQFYNLTINGNISTNAAANEGDMEIYGNLDITGIFSPSLTATHSTIYFKPDDGSTQSITTNDVTFNSVDISGGATVQSDINLSIQDDLNIDATSTLNMSAGTSLVKSGAGIITIATGGSLSIPATSVLDMNASTTFNGSLTNLDGDADLAGSIALEVIEGESLSGSGGFTVSGSGSTITINDADGVSDVINMSTYSVNTGTNYHIKGGTTGLSGVSSTFDNLYFGEVVDENSAVSINITEGFVISGEIFIYPNSSTYTVTQTSGTITMTGTEQIQTNNNTLDFFALYINGGVVTVDPDETIYVNEFLGTAASSTLTGGASVATTEYPMIIVDGNSSTIYQGDADEDGISLPDYGELRITGTAELASNLEFPGLLNGGGLEVFGTGTLDLKAYDIDFVGTTAGSIAGNVVTNTGATIKTSAATGLAGNISTQSTATGATFSTGTNYEFNGSVASFGFDDIDGQGTDIESAANIIIDNSTTITAVGTSRTLTVSGDLTLTDGWAVFASGYISMGSAAGQDIINNADAPDLDFNSLIIAGGQTVNTTSDFYISGGSGVETEIFNVQAGAFTASSPSTIRFVPAGSGTEEIYGGQTITLFDVVVDGTTNDLELDASVTDLQITGDLTLVGGTGLTADDGATLEMSGTAAQTIETNGFALSLDGLTISNSTNGVTTNDNITLSTGAGAVAVSGIFNQTSGTVTFDDAANGAMAFTPSGSCTFYNVTIGTNVADELNTTGDFSIVANLGGAGIYDHSGNGNLTFLGDGSSLDSDSPESDSKRESQIHTLATFEPDQITIGSNVELKQNVAAAATRTVNYDVSGRLELRNVAITTTGGTIDMESGSTLHLSNTANGVDDAILGTGTLTVSNGTNYLFEGTQDDPGMNAIPAAVAGTGGFGAAAAGAITSLNDIYVNSTGPATFTESFQVLGSFDNASASELAASAGTISFATSNSEITSTGGGVIRFFSTSFNTDAETTASANIELVGTNAGGIVVASGGQFTSSASFTFRDDDGAGTNDIVNLNSDNTSLQFNDLLIGGAATALDFNSGFAVNGDLEVRSAGTLDGGTASTLELNGSNSSLFFNLNAAGDVTLHDVYVNGTVNVDNIGSANELIVVEGDFEVTNIGAFSMTDGGVDFDEAATGNQGITNNGSLQFHDFVLSQADQDDTLTVSDDYEINGTLTLTDGTLMNVGNIVTLSGTTEDINNTPNVEGELSFYSMIVSGGYTIQDDIQVKGDITVGSGGSLVANAVSDVVHMDSTGTKSITNAGTLTLGVLNIGDYENNIVTTTSDFTIEGSMIVGGGSESGESFTATGGTVTFQETGGQTIIDNNTGSEGSLQFFNITIGGVGSDTQVALGGDFSIAGNITILNDADFDFQTHDVKVTLNGSTQQTIDVTGSGTGDGTSGRFLGHDLTLNNTAGARLVGTTNDIVEDQVEFQGTLRLQNGDLDLNGNNILTIDLTVTSARLNEGDDKTVINSGASTATGHVYASYAPGAALANVDVAGMKARITTDIDPGTVTLRRYHIAREIAGNLQASRYYDITTTVTTGLNGVLTFGYDDSELGSLEEDDLILLRSTTNDGPWYKESTSNNTSLNRMTTNSTSGIDGFTDDYQFWTIGTPNEITGAAITENLASSPLAAGTDDNNIFGLELSSTGSVGVSTLRYNFGRNLANNATSFTLVYSADDDYSTTGDNVTLISGYSADANITGGEADTYVEFDLSGQETEYATAELGVPLNYFLLINVNDAVTGSTTTITPAVSETELTVTDGIIDPFTLTGTNYEFLPSIEVEPNENGLTDGPLVAGSSDNAIFGFKAEITSITLSPGFTGFTLDFDYDPSEVFSNVRFWTSTDDNFDISSDTEIALTTETIGSSDVTFGFAKQTLTIAPKYYFITADLNSDIDESIESITPTMVYADITSTDAGVRGTDGDGNDVASHDGFTYQIAKSYITVSADNNPAGSDLGSNLSNQPVYGFTVTPDNGQTVTLNEVNLLVALSDNSEANNFDQWKLYLDANGNGYGDSGEQIGTEATLDINADDDNLNFTGLTQSISAATEFIVTVRPKSSVTAGTKLSVQMQTSDYIEFAAPAVVNAGGSYPSTVAEHTVRTAGTASALEIVYSDATVISGATANILVRVVDANGYPTRVTTNTNVTVASSGGTGTVGGTTGYTINSGTGFINLAPTLTNATVSTDLTVAVTDDAAGLTASGNSDPITILEAAPSDYDGLLTFGTPTTTTIPITNISAPTTAGDGRIIVVRRGAVPADPSNGVSYTASEDISSAGDVGVGQTGPGSFVISDNTVAGAISINTQGLMPDSRYYFKVFEYTGSGANLTYSTGNNFSSETNRNPITVTTASGDFASSDSLSPSNIQTDVNITSSIATANDEDWFQFKLGATRGNARILASGLPANYHLQIYDATTGFASMTLLRESEVTGTSKETVTLNGLPTTGTYVIRIYGADEDAFSATDYTLRVSTSANEFYSLTSE